MRIWDVAPGYLNRGSLLGEHRELHGLRSILVNRKTGYSRHPETLRWVGCLAALARRHAALVAEMQLRGYVDRTPVRRGPRAAWPRTFVTEPADQLSLLRRKYVGREKGRIALPTSAQELWAQHKYSVMARSLDTCRSIGRAVARLRGSAPAVSLVRDLVLIVRECPDDRNTSTTIGQMWQHVRRHADADDVRCIERGPRAALLRIQALAMREREPVLLSSTALSDLAAFVCVP